MNTEARVLAMLNKVKEVQAQKKQSLGIIEDILTQTYSDLSDLQSQMKNIYLKLDDNINSTFDNISNEIETLGTDANYLKDEYTLLHDKFFELIDDLGEYGDYNTEIVDEMTTNFDNNVERVFSVQNEVMGKF